MSSPSTPPIVPPSLRAPAACADLFASNDHTSLVARLMGAGESPHAATRVAGLAMRYAYGRMTPTPDRRAPTGPTAFDSAWLNEAQISRRAQSVLRRLQLAPSLTVAAHAPADDGTRRLLLRAELDGSQLETVIIPGPARTTVCISSQVGCARSCSFCETGKLGLLRQLSTGEMVDQVRLAMSLADPALPAISNVVFMGMGEPFDNLAEVARATRVLTDCRAFGLSRSRLTVSTVGVADKLRTFFDQADAELAVSLNASTDEQRDVVMPINRRFKLAQLREAIVEALPHNRRVFFEYVLMRDFNDSLEDADRIVDYVRGIRSRVNVIPCNPGPNPLYASPAPEVVDAFVERLVSSGVTTLVRRPRGRDVGGACGQLAGAARTTPLASLRRQR